MYSLNMNTTKHLHYFGHSYTRTHTYSHSLSTWPKSGTTTVQVIDAPKKENRLWGVEFGLRYILLRKYASACMHNCACQRVANAQ